jgi:hypothetical protein
LTFVDFDDPETAVFEPKTVPVPAPRGSGPISILGSHSIQEPLISGQGCNCKELALSSKWPEAQEYVPIWGPTSAWGADWSEAEIRKESCRRLCWSAATLTAGHLSYASTNSSMGTMFFLSDPSNVSALNDVIGFSADINFNLISFGYYEQYALFFSGEFLTRGAHNPLLNPKETIWALHERCYLLWLSCIRMRHDVGASDKEKAQFSVRAWLEADVLEASLNRHSCDFERAIVYQGREYIFK